MLKEIRRITLESSILLELETKLTAQSIFIHEPQSIDTLSRVAAQLAYEGQINRVHWLHHLGASPHLIVQGYMAAGNDRQAALWIEYVANNPRVAEDKTQEDYPGTAPTELQNDLDSINDLLDNYLTKIKNSPTLSFTTLKSDPQRLFSFFTKHRDSQEIKAINALKQALRGEPIRIIEHLCVFRCGKLGQDLRAFKVRKRKRFGWRGCVYCD